MLDLRAFAQPDESALQLYARNYVEPVPTGIFFWEAVLPGHVLEVAGRSGCGKTNLLLQAALIAILPLQIGNHIVGGLKENVVYIDLDHKFDILRLMEFSCSNSLETLAALKTLGPYVSNLQRGDGIRLLFIDNISAFYWLDFPVKVPQKDQADHHASILTLQATHAAAAYLLKNLAKQSKLAVIVSKHCFKSVLQSEGEDVDYWAMKEMMCKSWIDIVSQRILLRKSSNNSFVPNVKFLAKLDKPEGHQVYEYSIDDAGIHPWQQAGF